MKKKVLTAILLAAAFMAVPIGGGLASGLTPIVAVASGNNTVSNGDGEAEEVEAEEVYEPSEQELIADQVIDAESGAVIELAGVDTLSNSVMHQLVVRGDVSMVLRYTYEGVDYVVTIPAGAAVDSDISWYGPLYLAGRYGNGATGAAGASYTVAAGDTMSKIARANGMTLAQLSARNPQISDVNRIAVGQKINLR